MLLWEGMLVQGENMAVIIPTVWEWDSRDPSESEIFWETGMGPEWAAWVDTHGINATFATEKANFVTSIARNSTSALVRDTSWRLWLGSIAGTRPIGVLQSELRGRTGYTRSAILLHSHVLTLTYNAAVEAVRSSPANLGFGVFALNYADESDHGDYALYVQIEQIK